MFILCKHHEFWRCWILIVTPTNADTHTHTNTVVILTSMRTDRPTDWRKNANAYSYSTNECSHSHTFRLEKRRRRKQREKDSRICQCVAVIIYRLSLPQPCKICLDFSSPLCLSLSLSPFSLHFGSTENPRYKWDICLPFLEWTKMKSHSVCLRQNFNVNCKIFYIFVWFLFENVFMMKINHAIQTNEISAKKKLKFRHFLIRKWNFFCVFSQFSTDIKKMLVILWNTVISAII